MSDVRIVSPRETVIEVDAHAVPGRPGVVTPGLRVLHDGAVDAAGAAASSATAAASSSLLATQKASSAVSAAMAADDAMQAASQAASDADQSRVGAAASALAASAAEQAAVAAQEGLVVAREAAAGSASSAATSASEAASSASSAATARSGAEAAAATATQKASAAASSATAAATSATNAATSASAAASSASNAASSAASISWGGLPGKPAFIGAGATAAAARTAIGATDLNSVTPAVVQSKSTVLPDTVTMAAITGPGLYTARGNTIGIQLGLPAAATITVNMLNGAQWLTAHAVCASSPMSVYVNRTVSGVWQTWQKVSA